MFCPNCGHQLNQDERFCPNCGAEIDEGKIISTKENVPNKNDNEFGVISLSCCVLS